MFEKLHFDMKKVYPTLVVSTMSSGKSTLINALVGTDLLPSMNQACTARAVAILDNDLKSQFEIHAVDNKGKYSYIEEATEEAVADFNKFNDISEMIIEGEIRGIKNSKKSLLLIDTPGINNCMNMAHAAVTEQVLNAYDEGLILYVINAQQIGTYDDSEFLTSIARRLKHHPQFNLLFVINKMDLIDPERESLEGVVENCRNYIQEKGIENPVLIPVSAGSALLFKKVLLGKDLTESEEEEFFSYYNRFKREGFSLQDYISVPQRGKLDDVVIVEGKKYTRAQLYAALENTGLPFLEKQIDETLVRSLKMRAPKIIKKRAGRDTKTGKKKIHKNTNTRR